MIGFAIFLFFQFDIDDTRIILICIFLFLGIIPLLITLHFFLRSKNIDVSIIIGKGIMEVNQNGVNTSLRLEDIKHLEIHEHKGLGFYEFDFDYAKYIFNDGKYCIVTSFMTNGYFIPKGIEPIITKEFLPLIWKRTNI